MNHVPKFQENVSTKNIKNNSRRTNVFRAMVERAAYWTFEGEFIHSCWSEDSSRQCGADQAPSHGESHGYHGPSSPAGSQYYLQLLLRTKDFSLRQKPIVTVTYNYWPIMVGVVESFLPFCSILASIPFCSFIGNGLNNYLGSQNLKFPLQN